MELYRVQTNYMTFPPNRAYEQVFKRVLDLALAIVALTLLWPVMLLIAVLVKLDSSGPAFFIQTRIGKDGVPFPISETGCEKVHSVIDGSMGGPGEITGNLRVTRVTGIDSLRVLQNRFPECQPGGFDYFRGLHLFAVEKSPIVCMYYITMKTRRTRRKWKTALALLVYQ